MAAVRRRHRRLKPTQGHLTLFTTTIPHTGCFNPCEDGNDPCSHNLDFMNKCVASLNGRRQGGLELATPTLANCGGYSCQCQGEGYLPSPDAQACTSTKLI